MWNLIGIGLTILGGVLTAVTGFMPLAFIVIIGVFMFASIPSEDAFLDYRIANSNELLLRKRHYWNFLPFTFVVHMFSLGRAEVKFVWKEEYFKTTIDTTDPANLIKLPRKDYIALRDEQRQIYSTQTLSKAFMEETYSAEGIGLQRKKRRLIIVSVLAGLMLTMITEPGGLYLALLYEALFVPMILLWAPEYKDAKILQQAYDRAMRQNSDT